MVVFGRLVENKRVSPIRGGYRRTAQAGLREGLDHRSGQNRI